MSTWKEITECPIDHGELVQVVDLEKIKWMKCNKCHFIQTKFQDGTEKYRKKPLPDANAAKREQMLLAIVKKAQDMVPMVNGDKVLDIGCGNGMLLGWYVNLVTTVGIDPSVELIKEGMNEKRIDIGISDYFSKEAVNEICKLMGAGLLKFKIITAVDVMDLVSNPLIFMQDCRDLLHEDGVIVIQVNHLMSIMAQSKMNRINSQFGFYNILPLRELVHQVNLDLQGIELQEEGTFRAYITRKGYDKFGENDYENKLWLLNNANLKMVEEMRFGIDNPVLYENFGKRLTQPVNDVTTQNRRRA